MWGDAGMGLEGVGLGGVRMVGRGNGEARVMAGRLLLTQGDYRHGHRPCLRS